MKGLVTLGLVGLLAALGGCSATSDTAATGKTATISGSLTANQRALDGARLMAVTRTNHAYSVALGANGAFALKVPASSGPYRLVVANAAVNGHRRVVGHLSARTARTASGRSVWISIPRDLNLGALRVVQAPSTPAPAVTPIATSSSIARVAPRSEAIGGNGNGNDGDQDQSGQDQQGEVEEQADDLCGQQGGNDDHQDADVSLEAEGDNGDLAGGSSSGSGGETTGGASNDGESSNDSTMGGDDTGDHDPVASCGG
jgi:hypothetical protein